MNRSFCGSRANKRSAEQVSCLRQISASGLGQQSVRKKSNQIRFCTDFSTGLNQALKDHHYPLPSPEEIFNKINGGKIFSKVDISDAYIQIEVEENSSKLQCVNTYRGLYEFYRLAFGVKVAPAIFQQVMDAMLGDLDFATAYLDDILIPRKSVTEHRKHIMCVFDKLQEYGFKVKEAKCDFFFLSEIKYFGHIINKDGRRPDSHRTIAIKDMPAPDNAQALQSSLGLANFLQIFKICIISGLSSIKFLRKIKPGVGHQNAKLHSKK